MIKTPDRVRIQITYSRSEQKSVDRGLLVHHIGLRCRCVVTSPTARIFRVVPFSSSPIVVELFYRTSRERGTPIGPRLRCASPGLGRNSENNIIAEQLSRIKLIAKSITANLDLSGYTKKAKCWADPHWHVYFESLWSKMLVNNLDMTLVRLDN